VGKLRERERREEAMRERGARPRKMAVPRDRQVLTPGYTL